MTKKLPVTFWIGLSIILICEGFLFADVHFAHRGPIHTQMQFDQLSLPTEMIPKIARWFAVNMTALAWTGLIFLMEGVLYLSKPGSPARNRPHHFATLWIASIFIWALFDVINFWIFYPNLAWRYVGVPERFSERLFGYVLAFAAVVPGMLMIGQALLNRGVFRFANCKPITITSRILITTFLIGVAMFGWPMLTGDRKTNYTLWTSLAFLLDPINYYFNRPSLLRDLSKGSYKRMLAACAGGLICGFLWEFWNYFALAKWVYDLPFLGWTEKIKYFEMPIVGLLGFIPFGAECWVIWQTMRIPFDGLIEPLPDLETLL